MNVAVYTRVSTNLTEQENSLLSQRKHWEEEIEDNPDWTLYDLYIEDGVTGTSTDHRPELKRLLSDCEAGRINLVVTKSISRFARNVVDCLHICRGLGRIGVAVYFEKENIRTDSEAGELMLTLFATVAEEESRSIQTNSQWSIQKRFQEGTYRFSHAPFGYQLTPEGRYEVDTQKAPIVRDIFEMATSGMGTPTIAKSLSYRGISTGSRRRDGSKGVWNSSMVRGILKNELYKGDLRMQKTFTDESFRTRRNTGQRDQYLVHDEGLAIIDSALWEKANEALQARRTTTAHGQTSAEGAAGEIFCLACGRKMRRITKHTTDGAPRVWWVCGGKANGCTNRNISDEDLDSVTQTVNNKLTYLSGLIGGTATIVGIEVGEDCVQFTIATPENGSFTVEEQI